MKSQVPQSTLNHLDQKPKAVLTAQRIRVQPLSDKICRTKINPRHHQPSAEYAPALFHFIWIGGPIPPEYLHDLQRITKVAKKSGFQVNFWVDSLLNYHQTSVAYDIDIPDLQIKSIDELIEGMKQDPFHGEDLNFSRFLSYVNREMIGYKNLASASDWLRYEILRQFGGYYFDTDLKFILDEHSLFIPDELPLGIKLRTDLKILYDVV